MTATEPDVLSDVERHLVVQRRAVLLVGEDVSDQAAMTSLSRAAARRSGALQVLDVQPAHYDDWLDAAIAAGEHATPWEFFTPLTLAYRNKYGGECEFGRRQQTVHGVAADPTILVSLTGLTRNPNSHAWTYFAPEFRKASSVLAFGRLNEIIKLRPLIELIHPVDQCVVWAPGYDSHRLG